MRFTPHAIDKPFADALASVKQSIGELNAHLDQQNYYGADDWTDVSEAQRLAAELRAITDRLMRRGEHAD